MVAADGIRRTFGSGHTAVHALRGVSFTVDRGQLVALRGRSGSGKTTLLNIIGGLDDPTAGRVWLDGREVNRMTGRERLALRRNRVAFIFQSFGLVPMLTAAENIGIPLRIAGVRTSERRERVAAMLRWSWPRVCWPVCARRSPRCCGRAAPPDGRWCDPCSLRRWCLAPRQAWRARWPGPA
jgi:ABC-type lipoprotein export system ATPase subunit